MDILPIGNLDLLASPETSYEQTDIRNSNEKDLIEDLIEGAQIFVDKIIEEKQIMANKDCLPHENITLHHGWNTQETHKETKKFSNTNKIIIFAAYKLYKYLDDFKNKK